MKRKMCTATRGNSEEAGDAKRRKKEEEKGIRMTKSHLGFDSSDFKGDRTTTKSKKTMGVVGKDDVAVFEALKEKPHCSWVFLMVNLSERGTRNTQVDMSENPETTMLMKNRKNRGQNEWVVLMRVGRFHDPRRALDFLSDWRERSRGLTSRIAKGFVLADIHWKETGSLLWINSMMKDEMEKFFLRQKLWIERTKMPPSEYQIEKERFYSKTASSRKSDGVSKENKGTTSSRNPREGCICCALCYR